MRPRVTCDGQSSFAVMSGDRVRVHKKDRPARFIHPAEYNYFALLRAKLHWEDTLDAHSHSRPRFRHRGAPGPLLEQGMTVLTGRPERGNRS
jgi:hypothetical protein